MIVIHPIRRNDYRILKFVWGIVWLVVAIVSVILLGVLTYIVISPFLDTFGCVVVPVAVALSVVAGFFVLSHVATNVILHALGLLYRLIRRLRLPDPSVRIDQECFHLGQRITLTVSKSELEVRQAEVQLIYRLEHRTLFDMRVTSFSIAGLRNDQVMDTVLRDGQGKSQAEEFTLNLPDTLPSVPIESQKTYFGLIRIGTQRAPIWLAKVTVRVAGWFNYCEYYPIRLC